MTHSSSTLVDQRQDSFPAEAATELLPAIDTGLPSKMNLCKPMGLPLQNQIQDNTPIL